MFKVCKLVDNSYVQLNVLTHNKNNAIFKNAISYINQGSGVPVIYLSISDPRGRFSNLIYPSVGVDNIQSDSLGISLNLRNNLYMGLDDMLLVKVVEPAPIENIIQTLDIRIVKRIRKTITTTHEEEIRDTFIHKFTNYYINKNQCLYMELSDIEMTGLIINIINCDKNGYCNKNTKINITSDDNYLNIIGSNLMKRDLFRDDYNFEDIGIGGLNKELIMMLRRCLSTRAYKQKDIDKLGIQHVKGMLLHGPPGTGKTLIARKIGSMITDKPPKIVNGPEILNKYVGESEKNIRELFEEPIKAQEMGNSELYVIIFDEIDAICKTRGKGSGTGAGINDNLVTQLLTMIDGYKALNNIFIIGMTNRKDLLDEALIRPGRLEVHVEIGLPDKKGREQIFRIHTNTMRVNNLLDDINISELAEMTVNYSGAEIEAVIKNAGSMALHENLIDKNKDNDKDCDSILITKTHILRAIDEVIPSFGNMSNLTNLLPANYIHKNHDTHNIVLEYIKLEKPQNTEKYLKDNLRSVLITGPTLSGKTVMALKIASDLKIANTKIIKAIDMVSFDEMTKVNYITDIVKNSYVSENSLIVIDDIEIAINYVKFDHQVSFSNRLYQMLITLLKTEPVKPNHKITFICTCTDPGFTDYIKNFFGHTINL